MKIKKCPNCGAPAKHATRFNMPYGPKGGTVEAPTTYECDTVTSPNWSPPIYSKKCVTTTEV